MDVTTIPNTTSAVELPLQRSTTNASTKALETIPRSTNTNSNLANKTTKTNGIKENNTSNLTSVNITASSQLPGSEGTSVERDINVSPTSLNTEVSNYLFYEILCVFSIFSLFRLIRKIKTHLPVNLHQLCL